MRKATEKDAQALAQLGRETFCEKFGALYKPEDLAEYLARSYDVELHRESLRDKSFFHILVEQGGQPVAFAKAGPCKLPVDTEGEHAYELQRLYVRSFLQGKGIGAKLLSEVLKEARRLKYDTIYLGVWEHNEDAQRFYARFGFAEVSEYKFYVGKQADRELIFRLGL